jgi:hypothetical protein
VGRVAADLPDEFEHAYEQLPAIRRRLLAEPDAIY